MDTTRSSRFCRVAILALATCLGLSACTQDPPPTEPAREAAPSVVTNEEPQQAVQTSESAPPEPTSAPEEPAESEKSATDSVPEVAADASQNGDDDTSSKDEPVEIEPLSKEKLEKLLAARLDGGMQNSFRQFANMFLVMSRIKFGIGIGLMSSSPEIGKTELQPVFPAFYKPTLREFLDAIALQTFSEWKYDPTGKFVKSSVKHEKPVSDLAVFEFTPAKRERPFSVTLMDGWKSGDKGHWLMLIPPSFPVGMDIYEVGTYSADNPADEAELFQKVRAEVALEWAQRVRRDATADDMKPAKVGDFDALHYTAMVPSQLGRDLRWRQWVFMSGNRCYFIASTITPDLEDEIFPDVEVMLGTFRSKSTNESVCELLD